MAFTYSFQSDRIKFCRKLKALMKHRRKQYADTFAIVLLPQNGLAKGNKERIYLMNAKPQHKYIHVKIMVQVNIYSNDERKSLSNFEIFGWKKRRKSFLTFDLYLRLVCRANW